jgi:phage repressor protein C with HTH and peptisase S24 domain/DNA-binding transcriptional regulator YiaG
VKSEISKNKQEVIEVIGCEEKPVNYDALEDKKARQKEVGSRLGLIRRDMGLKIDAFETKTGIPVSTLKKYESGISMPGGEALSGLVAAGININWLLSGTGQMYIADITEIDASSSGEYSYVQNLVDVHVSAGDGATATDGNGIEELAFKRKWLAMEGLSAKNLRVVACRGDSMAPTIPEDSTLLVDISQNELVREGIYVIRLDGHLFAKRLQRGQGGSIHVISDNTLYDKIIVTPEQHDLQIIGKTVWLGHTM